MMQTGITWRFTVQVKGDTSGRNKEELLEEHLDCVADELMTLEECNEHVHDTSIGAELATGSVEIELMVDGRGPKALQLAESVVRAAIHAAGGHTPWDNSTDTKSPTAEYTSETQKLSYAGC
ncbi:hypothetical protein ACP4TB_29780 [Streptomyces sp. DR3-1]|uniref:hypothetical protein n=1 Tax=Streptomyces sp. DR3-1 TaxID=2951169 RepID=UPI00204398B9|nr:hypothetical protein [Streptomyces sp. DR3-1]MCM3822463.1 hypothetical protein [Streptomyces sp. DR3-1]